MRNFPLAVFVLLVSGYLLWSAAFVALYGGHGLVCMFATERASIWLVLIWTAAILAHAALAFWLARLRPLRKKSVSAFIQRCAAGLAIAALFAAIGVGVPIILVAPCA